MPAATPEILASTPAEFARLTRIQKIAMLLVVLGEETAVSFLRGLQPDELESISAEMMNQLMKENPNNLTHALRTWMGRSADKSK